MMQNPGPLLEYVRVNGNWLWRGSLLSEPRQADRAAARLHGAFDEVAAYLRQPEDVEKVSRLSIVTPYLLEVEADTEDFEVEGLAGFEVVQFVGKRRKGSSPKGEFSADLAAPAPSGESSFLPVHEQRHWKGFAPQGTPAEQLAIGLERAVRSAFKNFRNDPSRQRYATVLFEKEGDDILLVATDSHRMSVHRLVGLADIVTWGKEKKALVALPELREMAKALRKADQVLLDLSYQGEKILYYWGKDEVNPEFAHPGEAQVDGKSSPLYLPELSIFPEKWREILPKSGDDLAWQVVLNAPEVLEAAESLERDWAIAYSHVMKVEPRKKEGPEGFHLVLSSKAMTLWMEKPAREGKGGEIMEVSVPIGRIEGLKNQISGVVNRSYLKDALSAFGEVLLAGYAPEKLSASDSAAYLTKPLVFLDPQGPTEILVMPMRP